MICGQSARSKEGHRSAKKAAKEVVVYNKMQ